MKLLLLIGGLVGFGIGLLFSWAQESSWPACFWHACIAAYLASLLMRWWGQAWRKSLEASFLERQTLASQIKPAVLAKAGKS